MYGDWLASVTRQFEDAFGNIEVEHNFDYGPEFEIAICNVLRTLLPRRYGVCRGFVVAKDGSTAGDDIIVFEADRYPVLRALGEDLSRKQKVPAEAVLAYIEAKRTLQIQGTGPQSLHKAASQTNAVKALVREKLEPRYRFNYFDLGEQVIAAPGMPDFCNPWYTAIWCRKVDWGKLNESNFFPAMIDSLGVALTADFVATPKGCLMPARTEVTTNGDIIRSVNPFIYEDTEHVWLPIENQGLGLAVFFLLYAIGWINLPEIDWAQMISSYMQTIPVYHRLR
jgi:hypothetical protein